MKYLAMLVLLFCSVVFAQDTMTMPDGTVMTAATLSSGVHYHFAEDYHLEDNQANCVAHNCLLLTNIASGGGAVSFVQVSSGFDGSVYGIDGVGNVWMLPFSTSTSAARWTKVTAFGSGIKGIAVRSSMEIYALYSDPACPTAYSIKRWDGAAYHGLWGCIFSESVTEDGTLVGIGTDHQMYYTLNPRVTQPAWVGVAAPGGATWSNVVAYQAGIAYGNVGTVLYQINMGTGVSTAVSGAPAVSNTANNMAVSPDGYLFVRSSTSTTKGNLWVYPFTNDAAPWSNVMGTVAILGGNTRDTLFAQDSSGYLYHYLSTAVSHTSVVSGYFNCGVFPSGCPTGSLHTAYASGRFLHGSNTAVSSSLTAAPNTVVSVPYHDVSQGCDPFFGNTNSGECLVSGSTTTVNNHVQCSKMGLIYAAVFNWPSLFKVEPAYTRAYNTLAGPQNCFTSKKTGLTYCNYPVDNWCSNTATPDLDMHNAFVNDVAGAYSYWDLHALCINILNTGWTCGHGFGKGIGGGLPAPSPNCTYNP